MLHAASASTHEAKLTLTFLDDLHPLEHVEVRLCSVGEEVSFTTNERGDVELSLDPGVHWFKVLVHGQWRYTVVKADGHQQAITIDTGDASPAGTGTERPDVTNTRLVLQNKFAELGGRYRFEEILGRGGAGIVLLARDQLLMRPVAVKILHSEVSHDPRIRSLFLKEARGLARLSHPNMISLHDVLTSDGEILMVTEYIRGKSLDKLLREQGPMDQRVAVKFGIQLVRAIGYLHSHNYVHRDIKPSNIMIQPDGTLKLIDFGLASSIQEMSVSRLMALGTPHYMAPEQLLGEASNELTDIYQIGMSLYHILAGAPPFVGEGVARAQIKSQPKRLDKVIEPMSKQLADIVHKCIDKRPERRWQSSAELLQQLRSLHLVLSHEATAEAAPPRAADNSRQLARVEEQLAQLRQTLHLFMLLASVCVATAFIAGLMWGIFAH